MRETMPGIRPPNTPTLASGYMNLVVSAETIRSQVMTMQIAPPITQPWVAAITGLESLWLTSGHGLPHRGRRLLEVGADAEGRPIGLQNGDLVAARLEAAIGLVKLVAQSLAERIALFGARHRYGGDAFARFDLDQTHGRPPVLLAPDASSRPYLPHPKRGPHQETFMQTRNPFIDDLTKMANGAMGALTGVKDEVEARVRDQIAKILDGMDIPRRDEFEAVKAMAAKAREENEELKKQIAELQAKLGDGR